MEPKQKVVIDCERRKTLVHIYEVKILLTKKKEKLWYGWLIRAIYNLVIVNVGFVCNTHSLYGCLSTKNCDMDDDHHREIPFLECSTEDTYSLAISIRTRFLFTTKD